MGGGSGSLVSPMSTFHGPGESRIIYKQLKPTPGGLSTGLPSSSSCTGVLQLHCRDYSSLPRSSLIPNSRPLLPEVGLTESRGTGCGHRDRVGVHEVRVPSLYGSGSDRRPFVIPSTSPSLITREVPR